MKSKASRNSEDRLSEATGAAIVAGLQALRVTGDNIAKKHGYRSVKGIDAVKFHLMNTHHWLPSEINSMSVDDLVFAIGEDLVQQRSRELAGDLKTVLRK